jgi:hypothetical protein
MTSSARTTRRPLLGRITAAATGSRSARRVIAGEDVRRKCPGRRVTNPWPLQLAGFGCPADRYPCARLHARVVLDKWGLSIVEATELIVSELVTNAVTVSARYGDEPS